MIEFNKAIISCTLSRDPELSHDPQGAPVCNFGIVNKRSWIDSTQTKKEEVNFIDCYAWGKLGEKIAERLRKGSPILLEGKLRQETWTEKRSGERRSKVMIVATHYHALEHDDSQN